jgi:very-short-patch-repair endonuclease
MFSRKLVIEVDGDLHGTPEGQARDLRRDTWLRSQGFDVLRYSAQDVEDNLEGVVFDIRRALGMD